MSFWCIIGSPTTLYLEEVEADGTLDGGDVLAVYTDLDEAEAGLRRALACFPGAESYPEALERERSARRALPVDAPEWRASLEREATIRNAMISSMHAAAKPGDQRN